MWRIWDNEKQWKENGFLGGKKELLGTGFKRVKKKIEGRETLNLFIIYNVYIQVNG